MPLPDMCVSLNTCRLPRKEFLVSFDKSLCLFPQRGGRGGSGDQGDAGVARDSVVNQLLAKMDGVAPLVVPTLVIALTNKRSLIDAALLRPGRFEVQIEVPPPKTIEQRVSILRVHTRHMQETGRLLVRDAPIGTAAGVLADTDLSSYSKLLQSLAEETHGYSGASLAGVARAAASHALERAIEDDGRMFVEGHSLLSTCVVTVDDFQKAIDDFKNLDDTDFAAEDSVIGDDQRLPEETEDAE
jgi:SpoVK/Ycf46/Vps4 family AAA+-type ATPase